MNAEEKPDEKITQPDGTTAATKAQPNERQEKRDNTAEQPTLPIRCDHCRTIMIPLDQSHFMCAACKTGMCAKHGKMNYLTDDVYECCGCRVQIPCQKDKGGIFF